MDPAPTLVVDLAPTLVCALYGATSASDGFSATISTSATIEASDATRVERAVLAEFGDVCFGVMEPATFGRLDLPGCAFPADDTNVVPALQKPKVAPRIQKAAPDAADAPPARARDHGVAFGKNARRTRRAKRRAKGRMYSNAQSLHCNALLKRQLRAKQL